MQSAKSTDYRAAEVPADGPIAWKYRAMEQDAIGTPATLQLAQRYPYVLSLPRPTTPSATSAALESQPKMPQQGSSGFRFPTCGA